jgi:hypothetical protein
VEISICASAAESGQVETPQAIKFGQTAMLRWTASGQKGPFRDYRNDMETHELIATEIMPHFG